MTEKVATNTPPPHPLFIVGLLAIPSSFLWGPLIILSLCCLGWWCHSIEKPRLLERHKTEAEGESIDLGKYQYPLTDCSMTRPMFSYFQHGFPQVRQLVTLQHMDSGTVQQFWLITRTAGPTTLHPIIF
ncbi:hypothetical protein [Marinobacter sp. ELB17]|uniref:hypothetical protein n=1 Tax=Marinobacter sp. ELB17 TaxID=270374 RepID=UPI0000F36176|nr:hypothetical protein [Marinobacter sp. ELB17]EAZ97643.1 hypothetical protein MELB17_23962 [Marinobacter sp. ELB17]